MSDEERKLVDAHHELEMCKQRNQFLRESSFRLVIEERLTALTQSFQFSVETYKQHNIEKPGPITAMHYAMIQQITSLYKAYQSKLLENGFAEANFAMKAAISEIAELEEAIEIISYEDDPEAYDIQTKIVNTYWEFYMSDTF